MTDNGFEFRPPTVMMRVHQAVDYLFYLTYGIIALVILLELAGARDSSGFKQFLNTITSPLLGPFVGLFPDLLYHTQFRLRISYFVALFVYILVHLAVLGLLRVINPKKQVV